jgi:hypothetical protein
MHVFVMTAHSSMHVPVVVLICLKKILLEHNDNNNDKAK